MLDNLYEEYAKLIEDVMNDRDRLLKEGLDLFAQTGADVQDVIKDAAEEHGYEMTEEMEKIISSIEGMGSLDSYLGVGGTVTQSLDGIAAEIRNAYTSLSSDFRSISGSLNSTGHEGDYSTAAGSTSSGSTSGDSTSTGSTGTQPSDTGALQDAAKRTVIGRLLRNGTNAGEPKSSLNKYIYNKYGSALTEGGRWHGLQSFSDWIIQSPTLQLTARNTRNTKRRSSRHCSCRDSQKAASCRIWTMH